MIESAATIELLKNLIREKNAKDISVLLMGIEAPDIASIFDEFSNEEQHFLYDLMDNEKSAEVLLEIDEDERKNFLKGLSTQEIADEIINEIDSDDAADIISELPEYQQTEIIQHLNDEEHAQSIVDLLRYDEDEAGGLMATELVKVNQNLSIIAAVKEMMSAASCGGR